MSIPLVDLQAQHQWLGPELHASISEVFTSGDFILGAKVGEFEQAFARFIGTRHCIGVASGTDALCLILRALGIGQGDKVVLPANTFIATALAVTHAGATPLLADIEPSSYTLDMDWVRRSCRVNVKAIIPVHLYGQPADMDSILAWAQDQGVIVIEDAAQAHGAVHRRGRCGTFGQAAAFSFYPAKNLGACGDAGAICTDDDNLAETLRLLRNWGSSAKYIHQVLGFNSRLDTLQAAVLLVKLRHLAESNSRRRDRVGWYRQALAPLGEKVELPNEAPWTAEHVYHLFVIKLRGADRDAVIRGLHARGIGAGIHYPVPLHLQKAYSSLGLGPGSFPATEEAAGRIISLPLYPELTRDQVDTVVNALYEVLQ